VIYGVVKKKRRDTGEKVTEKSLKRSRSQMGTRPIRLKHFH
jgi:hypothetical protein